MKLHLGLVFWIFFLFSIINFFVSLLLQKYFLLEAMSSEFDNSRLASVFCTTNGMYFVDMLLEIIFVYPCLFCDSRYYVNLSSSLVSSFLGFWRPIIVTDDLREYESSRV